MIVAYTALYLYAFLCVYIGVMGVYRAHLDNRLTPLLKVLLYPFVVAGVLIDVVANLVIAPVIFLDIPREWLVTQRLVRYIKKDIGWRGRLAQATCSHLLDVFDPTGRHCV